LLDRKGHTQADMRVLRLAEDEVWLDTEPETLDTARRHLEMYKIGREVEVEDLTAARAIVSLIGPRSAELAGAPPLPEHRWDRVSVAGIACIAVGTDLGIDLIADAGDGERLIAGFAETGAPMVSPDAAEIVRIESGRPRFGAEMDAATMPAEAGIVERAVDFEKGCYIGQETVARLHYRGKPNRHLRGLRLSAPAPSGAVLVLDEKEVGKVGGSCISPAHGPIALAIVRREAEPGTELTVGEDGVTARVVDLPFG
jgi:folate-binding protein YgfZ